MMAEIARNPADNLNTSSTSDIVTHSQIETNDSCVLTTTTSTETPDVDCSDEPPTKKCRIQPTDKPRLLEDRLGSILSCCICLDLSTLPMFQVS